MDTLGDGVLLPVGPGIAFRAGHHRPFAGDLGFKIVDALTIFGFALVENAQLQLPVAIARSGHISPARQFGLQAFEQGMGRHAMVHPLLQIGGGKCRVEQREHLPFVDHVAFANLDLLDDGKLERLHQQRTFGRNDLA